MRIIYFFVVFILAQSIFGYGLNGLWQGRGFLVINNQQSYDCDLLLDIEHTEALFHVKNMDFDCQAMHIKNKNNQILEVKNGRMIDNSGRDLGQISESDMLSDLNVNNLKQFYHIQKDISNELQYSDSVQWNQGLNTQITGHLRLIQSIN